MPQETEDLGGCFLARGNVLNGWKSKSNFAKTHSFSPPPAPSSYPPSSAGVNSLGSEP